MKQDSQNSARIDKGWVNMRDILDQKMPEKRKKRFILWWVLPAILLLSGVIYYLGFYQISGVDPIAASSNNAGLKSEILNEGSSANSMKQEESIKINSNNTDKNHSQKELIKEINPITELKNADNTQSNLKTPASTLKEVESNKPELKKSQKDSNLNKTQIRKIASGLSTPIVNQQQNHETFLKKENTKPLSIASNSIKKDRSFQTPTDNERKRMLIDQAETIFTQALFKLYSNNDSTRKFEEWSDIEYSEMAEIKVRKTKTNPIIWGVELALEDISPLESWGYSGGIFGQKLLGDFGVGMSLGWGRIFERPRSSDLLAADPSLLDGNNEILMEGEDTSDPVGELSQNNDTNKSADYYIKLLQSSQYYYAGLDASWNVSQFLRFNSGLGFEKYINLKSDTGESIFNNRDQFAAADVVTFNTFIPFAELGLQFNISNHVSLNANYRKALKDFIVDEKNPVNTTKVQLGLAYQF